MGENAVTIKAISAVSRPSTSSGQADKDAGSAGETGNLRVVQFLRIRRSAEFNRDEGDERDNGSPEQGLILETNGVKRPMGGQWGQAVNCGMPLLTTS